MSVILSLWEVNIMSSLFRMGGMAIASLSLLLAGGLSAPADDAKPSANKPAAAQTDIEVQARGPVHEAFAQPLNQNPKPTAAVPKKPPEPIPEEPPTQKPQGNHVQWIPGYWAWDSDKQDFLWVSGTWR